MRLAQIARKVDTKPQEIRKFIREKFQVELDADPNTKLDDEQVNAILEHFKVEETSPTTENIKSSIIEEPEIDHTIDTDIDALKEVAEAEATSPVEINDLPEADKNQSVQENKSESMSLKKSVEIKYASEDEKDLPQEEDPTKFQEVEVNPDAELIAAKVEKLSGLKVVGKIDLGEKEPAEEDLPTADAIEDEIDALDGDIDTSEYPDLSESSSDDEREAIFAELDAQMDKNKGKQGVKKVFNEASEVNDNIAIEDDENAIYKNSRGFYRFTAEQKQNRSKSLGIKREEKRTQAQKAKKKRHYEENVATKVKPAVKKNKQKPIKKSEAKKQKEAPKGFWKKFLRWLND